MTMHTEKTNATPKPSTPTTEWITIWRSRSLPPTNEDTDELVIALRSECHFRRVVRLYTADDEMHTGRIVDVGAHTVTLTPRVGRDEDYQAVALRHVYALASGDVPRPTWERHGWREAWSRRRDVTDPASDAARTQRTQLASLMVDALYSERSLIVVTNDGQIVGAVTELRPQPGEATDDWAFVVGGHLVRIGDVLFVATRVRR